MQKVKSSMIESIGHDGSKLTVKFKRGGTYSYDGVPKATFDKLLESDSTGEYLHDHIIGKYKHAAAK
ncbi:KTSC domain-containing protein [Glaciimonas immobilis]|nr:KTSC domain-containing protein [Glaciimonas immobilis]